MAGESHQHVSILVFLDSLPRPLDNSSVLCQTNGFQSLFFWIHFHDRIDDAGGRHWRRCVSILVFLDSLPRLGLDGDGEPEITLFQSLFFWIHFHDALPRAISTKAHKPVSILVFLDSLPRPRSCRVALKVDVSILVFLDSLPRPEIGGKDEIDFLKVFQSLFFWIHFHDLGRRGHRVAGASRGFNPCFSGFTSTTCAAVAVALSPHGKGVSILVFLDSLPRPLNRAESRLTSVSWFQSLFFWIHFHER